MTNEQLISIAERNLKKARIAFEHNYNRSGVTEHERRNLSDNLEYANIVLSTLSGRR